MNVPKLKFPGFEGEWVEKRLGECGKFYSGTGFTDSEQGGKIGIPFFKVSDMNLEENKTHMLIANNYVTDEQIAQFRYKVVKEQSIIFAKVGAAIYLERKRIASNFCIDNNMMAYTPIGEVSFFYHILSQIKFSQFAQVGALPSYNASDLQIIQTHIPSLEEQQKIAEFLSSVDNVIQLLTKKKNLLENYKKGIMQKIFSLGIRFKDDNGNDFPEWEEKRLFDVSDRIRKKNNQNCNRILTISARSGLVSQEDFFNSRVASRDLSGYYLLAKDDFAYNKSYSNGYPMGAIKRLKLYDMGVVSSLYICFRFNQHVLTDFMEQYFEAGLLNYGIESVAQEGARNHGLLNISINDFFGILLLIPSLPEQQKIADFLLGIDRSIEIVNSQIEKAKEYKKGLLQQMFV